MLNTKITISSFLALLMLIPAIALFLFLFQIPNDMANSSTVWFLSVLGWCVYLFCLYVWKRKTGQLFCPYIIFFSFAFVFHYGQCLMWAFNIHLENEIGTRLLYGSIVAGVPYLRDIIRTQVLCLMGLYAFHCGALLVSKRDISNKSDKMNIYQFDKQPINVIYRRILLAVSIVSFLISMPLSVYDELQVFFLNQQYGYGASLYGGFDNSFIHWSRLLSWLYFPSMIGLLIGSSYRLRYRVIVYVSFLLYSILSFGAGDRGTVLYTACFLIWAHHCFYKHINWKQFLVLLISALFVIQLFVGIRNIRSEGVSLAGLTEAIMLEKNPLVSAFFEMGSTMSVVIILLKSGWNIYPFGNTYLLAIPGMITDKIILFFIPNYSNISGWFSQTYLNISFGAGFSMIGEALVNFGPYCSLLVLFILGIICSKLMYICLTKSTNLLFMFFQISTARMLVSMCRDQILVGLKTWFFSTFLFCLFIYFLGQLQIKRISYRGKNNE